MKKSIRNSSRVFSYKEKSIEDAYLIPLGKPIDGIILYKSGDERKFSTIEVKTGRPKLSDRQREILKSSDGICIHAESVDRILNSLKDVIDEAKIREIVTPRSSRRG